MFTSKSNQSLGVPSSRYIGIFVSDLFVILFTLSDRHGCALYVHNRYLIFNINSARRFTGRGPNKPCHLTYIYIYLVGGRDVLVCIACLDGLDYS